MAREMFTERRHRYKSLSSLLVETNWVISETNSFDRSLIGPGVGVGRETTIKKNNIFKEKQNFYLPQKQSIHVMIYL